MSKYGGHGGMPGGGVPGGMNNMMKQAQRMQREMQEAQQALEEKHFTGTAGGGAVSVDMKGDRELVSVTLAPEVVDPEDIEMLQDLIVAAVNAAGSAIDDEAGALMSKVGGGLSGLGLSL